MAKKENFTFGAIKDKVDNRDFIASTVNQSTKVNIPIKFTVPYAEEIPVYNQGSTGSCVAHACATALALAYRQKGIIIDFSRGFIYGNRSEDDYQGIGMRPREALKHLNHEGDVEYKEFPFNFEVPLIYKRLERDKDRLFSLAKEHVIENYYRVYSAFDIKTALMRTGAVIVYVPVYDNFSDDLRENGNDPYDSAHEMCLIGWDETGWIVRNSWGDTWGNNGNGHIAYTYAQMEFWALTPIEIKDDTEEYTNTEEQIDNTDDNTDDDSDDNTDDDSDNKDEEELDETDEEEELKDDSDENDSDTDEEELNETDEEEDINDNQNYTDNSDLLIDDKRLIQFISIIKSIIKNIINKLRSIFSGNN